MDQLNVRSWYVDSRHREEDANGSFSLNLYENVEKLGAGLHKDCTAVIDEVSQVSTQMWHRLAPLSRLCLVI